MTRLTIALAALLIATPAHALERDKALHAVVGGTIYAGARVAGAKPSTAFGLCLAAGVAKEVYDSTGRGNVEALDVVATALPCAIAALAESSRKRATVNRGRWTPPPVDRGVIHFDPRGNR